MSLPVLQLFTEEVITDVVVTDVTVQYALTRSLQTHKRQVCDPPGKDEHTPTCTLPLDLIWILV
jgi:hypothetical protein